jgi:hypothetical protein
VRMLLIYSTSLLPLSTLRYKDWEKAINFSYLCLYRLYIYIFANSRITGSMLLCKTSSLNENISCILSLSQFGVGVML